MVKFTVFFSFLTLLGVSLAATRNYKTCKDHNDPSFSACLEEAANIYFANLDEEIDGIHHSWKPLNGSINNGPLKIDLILNITKFLNSTKSVKITLKYDASTKNLAGTIKAPHVGYESECFFDGKFGNIESTGDGIATCHIFDMKASFETHLHIKPGSKIIFEMEKLKFKIDSIKKATIELSNVRTKTEAHKTAAIGVVKTFGDQIYSLAKKEWDYCLQLHYEDLTREFLKEILDDGLVKND